MVDGSRVKGVAFRSVFAGLGKLRGEAAQFACMASPGEELRNGFTYGAIVSGGWYSIDWYKELFRAIRSSSGEGKELLHEIGRECSCVDRDPRIVCAAARDWRCRARARANFTRRPRR